MIDPAFIILKNFILILCIIIIVYIIADLLPILTGTVAGGIFLLGVGIGFGVGGIYVITQNWKKEQKKKEEPPHEN